MFRKLPPVAAFLLLLAFAAPVACLFAQQITDATEYNAYVAALGEKDPAKQVQLLDAYLAAYPKTVMKEQALQLKLRALQATGKPVEDTARDILQVNPNNNMAVVVLAYAFIQTPPAENDPALQDKLAAAEANAKHLVDIASSMPKPDNVSDDAFQASKNTMLATADQAQAIVGLYRKDYGASLEAFKKAAAITPNDGALFYRIGDTMVKEKPIKWDAALWAFARAVTLEGPGAMPAAGKQQVDTYLTTAYTRYHGSEEGLADLKAQAKAAPFPPDGFHIKTKAELAPPPPPEPAIPDDVTKMSFPQMETVLTKGDEKSKEVLGKLKAVGEMDFEGVIVAFVAPRTLHLAVSKQAQDTPGAFDVVLSLTAPVLPARVPKGKKIEFTGTVRDFKSGPFALVLGGGKIVPPSK